MLLFYCFIAQLHGARLFICILWFQASFIAHFSCLFLVTKYCMLSVHTDPVSAHSCETFCIVNKCWMTFKMTGQFGMKLLKRPLTVIFKIPKTGRLTEEEVLNEILAAGVKTASIRCIQLTPNKGFVTMNCQDSHSALLGIRIYIREQQILFKNADLDVTTATIKDAPVELPDEQLCEVLSRYGKVINRNVRHGKIGKTSILNGTRYIELSDVNGTIPIEMNVSGYGIRVFCDNGKTACKYCNKTNHPSFRCENRQNAAKRCYRCFSTSHVISECKNEVVCLFCGQTGHRQSSCEEKKELDLYGDYRNDIWEGRQATLEGEEEDG